MFPSRSSSSRWARCSSRRTSSSSRTRTSTTSRSRHPRISRSPCGSTRRPSRSTSSSSWKRRGPKRRPCSGSRRRNGSGRRRASKRRAGAGAECSDGRNGTTTTTTTICKLAALVKLTIRYLIHHPRLALRDRNVSFSRVSAFVPVNRDAYAFFETSSPSGAWSAARQRFACALSCSLPSSSHPFHSRLLDLIPVPATSSTSLFSSGEP
mmetsp:Transcript_6233/g.28106  ORF Transcript_6233/g.28106 Transcript_6233/m.28106 type:complete len:209 (+) Transcript_6233:272-898(+)